MNNVIVLLSEDTNTITITCEKIPNANSYTILGMNDYSSYEIVAKTNSNIITLERRRIAMYHNLKIDYIYDDSKKETYIGSTNPYTITSKIYEKLDVRVLESYNGLAVAITNDNYRWPVMNTDENLYHEKAFENYTAAIDDLKNWILQRLYWIDSNL